MRICLATAVFLGLAATPVLAEVSMARFCPPGSRIVYDSPDYAVCKGGTDGALTEIERPPGTRAGRTVSDAAPRAGFASGLRRDARERRGTLFCGYPHRPSDSVFAGGSGYIIKDDVRRRQGCL